ncbi:MAG: hypothetical protein JSW10_09410 [Pseudomonadota bacterium]|nr:MAG: hypothetical protein JSW10_09410 [Pseudomonadota bacterium]
MEDIMAVVIDGAVKVNYDRNKPLPGLQRRFLDKMDQDMDEGIALGDKAVTAPDQLQRALYVANHLVNALFDDNDALIAASCAYLANRLPDLKQVKVTSHDGEMLIDLVFDEPHKPESTIEFVKPHH